MLRFTSVSVFLFSALALAVSSGYSLGALALLLGSVCLLWKRPRLELQQRDRLLLTALLTYCLVFVANMFYHGDPMREFDIPLRVLLAVPVLLLLLAYPPHPAAWWAGLAFGAIGGAALAIWQFVVQHMPRPEAATSNAIHYGNVSMLMGMLALCGLAWARTQRHRIAWYGLLIAGCLAGIFGSIISGSRGGWLALPVCVLLVAIDHAQIHGKRYIAIILSAMALLMALAYYLPHSPVHERTAAAITQVEKFNANDDKSTSIGQRFEMWNIALVLSRQHPLIGLGRNGYLEQKEALVKEGRMGPSTMNVTNAHNDYLDTLVKRGAVGVLALLLLLLCPLTMFALTLRHGTLAGRPYALSGVVLCTCYLIFGLTTSSLTLNIGIIMLVFPMVILWALQRHAQKSASTGQKVSN
ncbi:O-antigen ligase family protein [Janthinobacterium aquaticum]|uniref:O-antigen ligase family protein n=1 Tax=Janthinobacterium sp. FT58W TaxID=2654254 RepID=UPI001264AA47|nr:O-antigen ligase family protein [Janthinobacterium sp. FT58W]KAB8043361.1 ligase [Janthinobacterium sp. FT58W]